MDRIRAAIVSGELAPGAIIKDADLAERLGLSVAPVRVALARLVDVLAIPDNDACTLDELRRGCAEPGWWQDYGDILSEPVEMLIELEVEAS